MTVRCGDTLLFQTLPVIAAGAAVGGKKESEGPLAQGFDELVQDAGFDAEGCTGWEQAESMLQQRCARHCLRKAGIAKQQVELAFAGDLQAQCTASNYTMRQLGVPFAGLYGACSTCGEALSLAAMTVNAGYASHVIAVTSSHFGGAEKQFRFPLEYGNQRPLSSTWTVTGSGAFLVSATSPDQPMKEYPRITSVTTGKIVDYGVRDNMNMGACMAPAAADVIYQCLEDLAVKPSHFDKIITGDLGKVGSEILIKLLRDNDYDIEKQHMDCGVCIFDNEEQDTHSGGSGCGCAAVTLAGYILHQLESNEWKRVLFVPTGALLSTVSFNEGQTIPGVAHAVVIEHIDL